MVVSAIIISLLLSFCMIMAYDIRMHKELDRVYARINNLCLNMEQENFLKNRESKAFVDDFLDN